MDILLRRKPYKIHGQTDCLKVSLSPICGLRPGDRVYEVKQENGVIMIIPEKEFKKTKFYEQTL